MRSSPFQCFGASPSPKRLRHWARRDARASRCLRFGSARSAPLGRPAASSCAAIRCIRYLRRVVPRSVLSRNARASAKACATDGGGVCRWARRAKVDVAQVTTSARSYRQGQLADGRRLASLRSVATGARKYGSLEHRSLSLPRPLHHRRNRSGDSAVGSA